MIGSIMLILVNIAYFALEVTGAGLFPKPLTPKQEKEEIIKMESGDISARNKLIEHNLRLVAHIVKKYHSDVTDQDDLISIGTIGLIKAISTYKSDRGINLSTYASRCIENEILMHFRSQKRNSSDLYIDDPIDTDKDGNTIRLMDIICCEEDTVEEISKKLENEKLLAFVNKGLSLREKRIIILRYGLNNREPMTQKDVAAKMKISRSYVSRIEKRALFKLKELLQNDINRRI